MGNPQERLSFELGYIIGLIDGEGSYQLSADINKYGRRYWSPKISIFNCNPIIIERCCEALRTLGVPFHVWAPTMKGNERFPNIRLSIAGIKRCKTIIDTLAAVPHGKSAQAALLKEFIDLRLSVDPVTKHSGHQVSYTERECEIKNELGAANKVYNTRGRILRDYTLESLKER